MLLADPTSSLLVRGQISAEIGHQNKTFIEEITFMSPGGSELTFDPEGAHIHGQNVRNNFQQEDNETFKFGDLTFTENWLKFLHSDYQPSLSDFFILPISCNYYLKSWRDFSR